MKNKKIRFNFPKKGDGESDGWVFKTGFGGNTIEDAYNKLIIFLNENGYEDIPIPKNTDELHFFADKDGNGNDGGYEHNPIAISFSAYQTSELWLSLFNENYPNHLLMFHNAYDKERIDKLTNFRINETIKFIEKKISTLEEKKDYISISKLKKQSKALLELDLNKETIIAALLKNAYEYEIISEEEIRTKFGDYIFKLIIAI